MTVRSCSVACEYIETLTTVLLSRDRLPLRAARPSQVTATLLEVASSLELQTRTTRLVLVLVLANGELLNDRELDALALGQRHERTRLAANHKHVAETRSEVVASRVLHVSNVERTLVSVASNKRERSRDESAI